MLASHFISLVLLAIPAFAMPATPVANSPSLLLDKRALQRESAARIALIKARAARKLVKRSEEQSGSGDLATRSLDEALLEVGVTKRDFELHQSGLVKRQQPRMRCGGRYISQADAVAFCVNFYRGKVTYSSTATVNCNAICSITCPTSGYTTIRTDTSTTCVRNAQSCNGASCPQSTFGVTACTNGACTLTCTTRGYKLNAAKTACLAYGSDINNCGTEGNKCASSYNGVYSPTCTGVGICGLSCPTGFTTGRNAAGQYTCVRS